MLKTIFHWNPLPLESLNPMTSLPFKGPHASGVFPLDVNWRNAGILHGMAGMKVVQAFHFTDVPRLNLEIHSFYCFFLSPVTVAVTEPDAYRALLRHRHFEFRDVVHLLLRAYYLLEGLLKRKAGGNLPHDLASGAMKRGAAFR